MAEGNGIKIILLGESGVGKTNLINISLDKNFEHNTSSTINSSYLEGILDYNNKTYSYTLWDTAGQEIYRALNKIFIKGAKIVLLVYAINNKNSFDQIEYWINSAQEILGEEKYIMALIGNKSDLYEEQIVPDEDGNKIAEKYKMKFTVASALTNQAAFKQFLKEIIIDYIELVGLEEDININFKLKSQKNEQPKKKCC